MEAECGIVQERQIVQGMWLILIFDVSIRIYILSVYFIMTYIRMQWSMRQNQKIQK